MGRDSGYSREGYLRENYHYFHLRDTAGQERDFHFHEFDKIVLLLSGRAEYAVESAGAVAPRAWGGRNASSRARGAGWVSGCRYPGMKMRSASSSASSPCSVVG